MMTEGALLTGSECDGRVPAGCGGVAVRDAVRPGLKNALTEDDATHKPLCQESERKRFLKTKNSVKIPGMRTEREFPCALFSNADLSCIKATVIVDANRQGQDTPCTDGRCQIRRQCPWNRKTCGWSQLQALWAEVDT